MDDFLERVDLARFNKDSDTLDRLIDASKVSKYLPICISFVLKALIY